MKARLVKHPDGYLLAATDEDKAAVGKLGAGEVVTVEWKRMRNYQFFRKWHALLRFAFDYFEPAPLPEDPEKRWMKTITPEKNYERFRKDITILCGYYESYFRLDGTARIEAKSVSFGSMSEEQFEDLYSKTIDVILQKVLTNFTEQELHHAVDEVLGFAA